MFRNRFVVVLAVVALSALVFSAVGAQATPVPLTAEDVISGAQELANGLGLFALVAVAAFVAVGAMMVRYFRRAAR